MESTLKERIIDVMEKALNIHFTDNVDFQYSLLDPRIGLKPRDLLVIFFALQESFHITFIENDIVEKRFDFLDNIVASVQEKLDAVSQAAGAVTYGVGNGFGYEVGYLGNRICEKDELKIMLQNGWNRKNLFKTM